MTNPLQVINEIEQAVLKAAQHIVNAAHREGKIEAWRKEDSTVVTALDLECDEILRRELKRFPILTEEDTETHSILEGNGTYILIDPIDGTTASRRFLTTRGGQVGFGPLVGLVINGKLSACSFYNVPQRTLFSAVLGEGMRPVVQEDLYSIPEFLVRSRIQIPRTRLLKESCVLFFVSREGESRVIEHLKAGEYIETFGRYGGFANDCSRLAMGYEDIQIQFAVKPWDFSAALLLHEAGLEVILDPLQSAQPFTQWLVQRKNPIIAAPSGVAQELLAIIKKTS